MQAPEQPKRRGRPPVDPDDRKDQVLAMRMSARQKAKLLRLAAAQGAKLGIEMSDAGWLLWQLDKAKDPGP